MNQKGFTLLEVMMTIVIFGVVSGSMASAFVAQAWYNTRAERITEAAAAAQQVLDALRFEDPASLPSSGSSDPEDIVIGDRTYQAVVHYCVESTFCSTANNRHLLVEVSMRDHVWYEVETVYTRLQ